MQSAGLTNIMSKKINSSPLFSKIINGFVYVIKGT